MSSQKMINKMRENVLNGTNNFIGIHPAYCDAQDYCKIVEKITQQYNQVVKQNQSLQREVLWQKEQMEKDNQYLIKLEEANMLLEQDVEVLKRQVEALQEKIQGSERGE